MKATILHDEQGRIIAISKVVDLKKVGSNFIKAGMVPRPTERVLEVDLDGDLESMPILELHENYHVDVIGLKLLKKKP
jgi:hypothetical protein